MRQMMQRPSVGRIVHYVSHGTPIREDGTRAFEPECRAAIVTEISEPEQPLWIGLMAMNPTGLFFHSVMAGGCKYADAADRVGGTWHWPERVEDR